MSDCVKAISKPETILTLGEGRALESYKTSFESKCSRIKIEWQWAIFFMIVTLHKLPQSL